MFISVEFSRYNSTSHDQNYKKNHQIQICMHYNNKLYIHKQKYIIFIQQTMNYLKPNLS